MFDSISRFICRTLTKVLPPQVTITLPAGVVALVATTFLIGSNFVAPVPVGGRQAETNEPATTPLRTPPSSLSPSVPIKSADAICLECTSEQVCSAEPEFRDWAFCFMFEHGGSVWCNHGSWEGHECQPFALAPSLSAEKEFVYSTVVDTYASSEDTELLPRFCADSDGSTPLLTQSRRWGAKA